MPTDPNSALVPVFAGTNDVRVYEYGIRLDRGCIAVADGQIRQARALYNDIVACMRRVYDELQAWVLERAGEDGRQATAMVEELNARFAAAKAANDEEAMKDIAQQRREAWRAQSACMGAVRRANAASLRELFYSRIGRNSSQEPYQLRCAAVAAGLGWATANDVLDRALTAWKDAMKLGRPPMFCRGDDKQQDTLVLQFTAAGGVDVARICDDSHSECGLRLPKQVGRRQYGSFRFRLGPAKAETNATGTVQVHRAMPPAAVSMARLVRRKHANKAKWDIQFVLRLREPAPRAAAPVATLASVHFGWASDTTGRRVAGIADAADPGLARLVQLPASIEEDLLRAAEIQSERDTKRDEAVPALKDLARREDLLAKVVVDADREALARELEVLRKLPAQHIAAKRFYILQRMLRQHDLSEPWLDTWVASDRKRWQASVGIARRARMRRREFYRLEALALARRYSSIAIEPLDLRAAAVKIDEATGERSEFNKKARAGRVVAALYEFEQEVRKAAAGYGRAVFELAAQPTVKRCACCGAEAVQASETNAQEVVCRACGATNDRKLQGAAMAWQIASHGIETHVVDFHAEAARLRLEALADTQGRKASMAEGRRAARAKAGATSNSGETTRGV